ncbi:MAG TPA: hypothetical protein VKF17_06225 [Isosphaeraceae bacterium]|nr:hypothetical protein [Isosphaeraceae bacterium]
MRRAAGGKDVADGPVSVRDRLWFNEPMTATISSSLAWSFW